MKYYKRRDILTEKHLIDGEKKMYWSYFLSLARNRNCLRGEYRGFILLCPRQVCQETADRLLYAFDTCVYVNNGEIGVEELVDALSEIFGVEINIKCHKNDSRTTYFLDELREKLNKRELKGSKLKTR